LYDADAVTRNQDIFLKNLQSEPVDWVVRGFEQGVFLYTCAVCLLLFAGLNIRIIQMRFLFCVLIFTTFSACASGGPRVEIGGKTFKVELADTRQKQALGLMFRDSMPADQGMLFIFPNEAPRSFWMKNTRIALDIMYFDKHLKLVSISADTPPCRVNRCPSYPSVVPAKYVLELNAGTASALGVGLGDSLVLDLD
jgi:uncharacterized membrane protein (UPF0127 family)